jgi:hypothetical protein
LRNILGISKQNTSEERTLSIWDILLGDALFLISRDPDFCALEDALKALSNIPN